MNEKRWEANLHHLFPTALFTFKIKDYETLNQRLLAIIYNIKQSDTGYSASNVLGWHSKVNLFELDEIKPFKALVDAAISDVAQAVGVHPSLARLRLRIVH